MAQPGLCNIKKTGRKLDEGRKRGGAFEASEQKRKKQQGAPAWSAKIRWKLQEKEKREKKR